MSGTARTVMLIRHGEKPGKDAASRGVNRHGEPDKHSLSVRGWTRAGALAAVLPRLPVSGSSALARPDRIFATRPTHSYKSTRERDTATPTARRLGIVIDDDWTHGRESDLARHVLSDDGTALIVWHHSLLPTLVRHFPLVNPDSVPQQWPEDRFDVYWILTRQQGEVPAYAFSEEPQSLLDGDAE